MKLLFVVSSIAIEGGGASKMLVWVANQFAKDGNDVTIYTHKVQNGPFFHIEPSIEVVSHTPQDNKCWLYPIPHVRRLIKQKMPNLVISFMSDSNFYCDVAKIFTGVPVCIGERSDPAEVESQPLKFKIAMWLTRLADGATFQLQQAADYYTWLKCPKQIIANPVAEAKAHVVKPFVERKNEICCSSRLEFFQKRQDVLIKAFHLVVQSHPEMKLRLIGNGPSMDEAKSLINELGLTDKVMLSGQIKDPIISMVDSKLFVLSSDFEGIPNALTEAMAAGLPCVSTDVKPGGARLLIENQKNGMIVPCNDPKAMADAIIYFLEHPDEADRMGKEAQKITNRFSEEKIYNQWKIFVSKIAKC